MIKTQKERIDKGRQAFNDEIIRCSESDNIYEAILEWEFTWEIKLKVLKMIILNYQYTRRCMSLRLTKNLIYFGKFKNNRIL